VHDLWLAPGVELVVGCVLLVLSWGWFWESTGAVWHTWHNGIGTVAVVLSAWFVYRAWKRKPETLRCYSCGEHVPIYEYDSERVKFWTLDCPRCGARYAAPVDGDGRPIFPQFGRLTRIGTSTASLGVCMASASDVRTRSLPFAQTAC
jgi:hypothetical protein